MKEIPNTTAGAIVPTGHLRAKRPGESVRNARCLHRCTGAAHTRGPGNDRKKVDLICCHIPKNLFFDNECFGNHIMKSLFLFCKSNHNESDIKDQC